jgi:hypothetical protein
MFRSARLAALLGSLLVISGMIYAAPRTLNNCTTITESGAYVLGRNVAATGDCLVVAADFVNIDLDGFVLTGNGTGSGVTEQLAVGRRGVTVRNGVITGFQNGVALSHSNGLTIDSLQVTANAGAGITAGDQASITRSHVSFNINRGISVGFRAMISGNNVNDNGIGIEAGSASNVTGNAIAHNTGTGVLGSEGMLVSNNTSRNNTGYGIALDCPGLVIGNTSTNNLAGNLYAFGGACDPNSQTCCVLGVNNMSLSSF